MAATQHYAAVNASDELIIRHAPLVKRIAWHLMGRLPDDVQVDDLIQTGMIGLLEASRNYDTAHGASFETYASIRVRGAMLDEVRRHDWLPRSVHQKSRQLAVAIREVENRVGRDARDQEIASEMGLSIEAYGKLLNEARGLRILSIEELTGDDTVPLERFHADDDTPLKKIERDDLKKALAEQINGLPDKEKLVLSLYYNEELNLREIGEVLHVSESRVCQIRTQALLRLRSRVELQASTPSMSTSDSRGRSVL